MKHPPLKIFFCYAHEDRPLRQELDAHLDLLEREGLVTTWYDGRITPGTEWSAEIQENMRRADLVVCLISKAFLKSEYIAEVEMQLALELQEKGKARVIPLLLEPIRNFAKLPVAKLEALPSKAKPISKWKDRVRALDDIVHGIRRAAIGFLIESGGAFEFNSHAFSEAELARLPADVRDSTSDGLKRLRTSLVQSVPRRKLDRNLLVASWCLRKRRGVRPWPESPFYLAQILSTFDIVALQEIDRDLASIREVVDILGPEWAYFLTDVKEGPQGNNERLGILYYRPRVAFEHVAGEVVLPERMLVNGRQFARKPLVASFRAGDFLFRICTAHAYFGAATGEKREHAIEECRVLAKHLGQLARRGREHVLIAGDFNMINKDSEAVRAFRKAGFRIPAKTLHPSNVAGDKYYDMIGVHESKAASGPSIRIIASGAFNHFEQVFRTRDGNAYADAVVADHGEGLSRMSYELWRTMQLSDHRLVWLELQLRRSRAKSTRSTRASPSV